MRDCIEAEIKRRLCDKCQILILDEHTSHL